MTVAHGDAAFYQSKTSALGTDPLRADADADALWHRVAVSQILKCEKEILKCQSLPEVAGCIRAQLERSDDAEEVMERAFALRNFRSGKIAQLRRKVVQKLDQEREQRFNTTNSAGGRR